MADTKISALVAATAIGNTDTWTIVQGGTNKKMAHSVLLAQAQTWTNQTLTSPVITTPTGIVKGDVGLGNVDNTSNTTERAATATLTNKTISYANNTIQATPFCWGIACSDETTDLTTGTAKATFRAPHPGTITTVRGNVNTAPVGSTIIVDINIAGSTIMTTNKLSIDASEKTSVTAATPPGLTTTSVSDDDEFTVDFDQVGSGTPGKGMKIWVIGTR